MASGIFNPGSGGGSSLPLPAGATNYIQNTETLQSGATFYVSSGTVTTQMNVGTTNAPYVQLNPSNMSPYDSGITPTAVGKLTFTKSAVAGSPKGFRFDNPSGAWVAGIDTISAAPVSMIRSTLVISSNTSITNGLSVDTFTVTTTSVTIAGTFPLLSTSTLQSGATIYVSSGSVASFSVGSSSASYLGSGLAAAFEIHGSSTNVSGGQSAQTLTVSNGPSDLNVLDTVFNVYRENSGIGQEIAALGCNQQIDQFRFFCGQKLSNVYGFGAGDLSIGTGGATDESICTNQSSTHCLIVWKSGGMALHTNNFGGDAPILFEPNTVEKARFTNSGSLIEGSTWTFTGAQHATVAATTFPWEIWLSTSAASFHVAVSTSGHIIYGSSTPAVSSCGTAPSGSVVGTDNGGTITVGGGAVLSCTLTFAKTWGVAPDCTLTDNSTAITGDISSISATAFTASFSASLGGGQIYYHCQCDQGASCL